MNRTIGATKLCTVVLLALALSACGGGDSSTDAADNDESAAKSAMDAVKDAASDVADAAGSAVDSAKDVADAAADAVSDAADDAADMASDAMDDAKDAADAAVDAVADAADSAADMASDAMDSAKDAAGAAVAAVTGDDPCALAISAGDGIAYSASSMSAPSSCSTITVTLTHTGSLPKEAMGHNWVLMPADAADAVAAMGMSAGVEGNYVPADDRVVAATDLVGGGESASVSFDASKLEAGTDYVYVCTFPGHWTIMKGTFSITG